MGKLIGKTYAAPAPAAVAPAAAVQPSAVFACPHCGKEYKTEKCRARNNGGRRPVWSMRTGISTTGRGMAA